MVSTKINDMRVEYRRSRSSKNHIARLTVILIR